MSVEDVAQGVAGALAASSAARQALAQADLDLTETRDIWAELYQASNDADARELPALAHECLARVGELYGQLERAEGVLLAYLDSIGATVPGAASPAAAPTSPTEPASRSTAPADTSAGEASKPSTDEVLERARAELPPRVGSEPGVRRKTHGRWWTAGGGELGALVSGRDDASERVDEMLRERGFQRRAAASSDVELKLAAYMADNEITDASVVINNRPCVGAISCDSLLPRLLRPGSTLTVYGTERDGTPFRKTYKGEAS